jgi:hypothetical protein
MRPFPRRKLSKSKRVFDYCISKGRRVGESAFGILASRCRILNKIIKISQIQKKKLYNARTFCTTQLLTEKILMRYLSLGVRNTLRISLS